MEETGRCADINEGQRSDPFTALDECQQIDRAVGIQASPVAIVRKRGQDFSAPGVRQVVVYEPGRATLATKPGLPRRKRQPGRIERESAGVAEIDGRVAEVHPVHETGVFLHDTVRRMDDARGAAVDVDIKPCAGRQRGSPRRSTSR